jgi:hypothetical protein
MEGSPVDTAFQHGPAVARGTIKDLLISIERPYEHPVLDAIKLAASHPEPQGTSHDFP